jgi:hypothetical protein
LLTCSGHLRVALKETEDGSDWKLQAWIERNAEKPKLESSDSKLIIAYLNSGRPRELLEQALSDIKPLSDYEIELLQMSGVEFEKNRRFFEMAEAILRESRFVTLLGESKADALEGRSATKSPTARLIHRVMEAVGDPLLPPPPRVLPRI